MTIDKLMKINNRLELELNQRYSDYELTINQAELLIYFYKYGQNEISATSAIEELKMDKRLMSLALKALETKGYIDRHPNANDKRQKDIELSLNALEICDDIIAIKDEVNAIFESELTDQQVALINQMEV